MSGRQYWGHLPPIPSSLGLATKCCGACGTKCAIPVTQGQRQQDAGREASLSAPMFGSELPQAETPNAVHSEPCTTLLLGKKLLFSVPNVDTLNSVSARDLLETFSIT